MPGPRLLLILQCVALTVLLSWPALPRVATEVLGSADADAIKHVWTLWWMRAEFTSGTPGALTTWVNFPEGTALYPIAPLDGLVAVLVPLAPATLANVLALGHLLLLGLCAGWLGGLVSGSRVGGLVAAALAQGSSFAAFTLSLGAGELRAAWLLPLGIGCWWCARATGRVRWFAALGLALAGAMISCLYYGFFLAISVATLSLATLRPSPRLLLGYAGAALFGVAAVVPVIRAFSAGYALTDVPADVSFWTWIRAPMELDSTPDAALRLSEFVAWRDDEREASTRFASVYSGGRYLGVPFLAMALAGLAADWRRAWPWAALALTGTVLSLGTSVEVLGHTVHLPLAWLNRALAWVAEPLNFPARFNAITTVALCVLACIASRWRWALALAPFAVIDTTMHGFVPWPRETFRLPDVAGLTAPEGALVDLTVAAEASTLPGDMAQRVEALEGFLPEARSRAIAVQLLVNRPMQMVPLERAEQLATSAPEWLRCLPLLQAMIGDRVADDDLRASVWLLRDRGYGAVFVSYEADAQNAMMDGALRVLDRWFGPRVVTATASLWPVPEQWSSEDMRTRWRREHAFRLEDHLRRHRVSPGVAVANDPHRREH